jgi:hypothetical protein
MAEPTPSPTVPELTLDDLNASIAQSVQKGIAEGLRQSRSQPQAPAPAPAADPLRDVIAPYIDPKINQLALGAASAMDYARFYTSHPEAVRHQTRIEKKFEEQLMSGAPLDRGRVFNLLRGEHFDEFMAEAQASQQSAAARAIAAGTVGASSGPHGVSFEDPFAMTPESLDAALSKPGVTF